jgi:lipopolysaccharide export system permease protein
VWVKDRDRDTGRDHALRQRAGPEARPVDYRHHDLRVRQGLPPARDPRGQGRPLPGRAAWQLNDVNETRFIELRDGTTARAAARDALAPDFRAEQVQFPNMVMHSELTPQILSVLLVTPERMSTLNLFRYIRHLRDNKQDTQRYEIAFWKKVVYPLTLFVMVALALPFAYLHARAGAVGVKVFGGIMLGLSFHLSNTLFSHVGCCTRGRRSSPRWCPARCT